MEKRKMSRELKFRVWNKNTNKYEYTELDYYFVIDQRIKAYEYEQYIGLKDENGKEIYEGDIIKFADLELAMKPTGVVCFADGKFFVKDWDFGDGSYHIVDFYDYNIPHRDFEVIGNIHENPELLGGEE